MGILISRFKKKPTTKEKLEGIEQELEDIEDFQFSTQQLQRRWVGRLIIFSVIVYLFGALLFFLYFFPSELSNQLLYSLPLLIFPLIVYALKWMLHWYYAYKLSQNTDQMVLLQRKKRKLLKEVMTTETYVVAKEILEKYDPDRIRQKAGISPFYSTSPSNLASSLPEVGVRRRSVPTRPLPTQSIKPLSTVQRLTNPIRPGYNSPPGTTVPPVPFPRTLVTRPQGIPLPFPILPRQRGTIDRLVEYVVGDGPNNRYALICRQCQSHNGMALREEFEYIGFRCCYCFFLNPARKQRTLAPRLSITAPSAAAANAGAAGDKFEGPVEAAEGEQPKESHVAEAADEEVNSDLEPIKTREGNNDSIVEAAAGDNQDVKISPVEPLIEMIDEEVDNDDMPAPKKDVADDGEAMSTSRLVHDEELTSRSEGVTNPQSDE